jgi:hypothetical protein
MKKASSVAHQFLFVYSCFIYCCHSLCPNSKCNSFFFLGMGSKVQSRWEQDSFCGWRSINKYIWLPILIFCFTLWTMTPHFLWLSSYERRKNWCQSRIHIHTFLFLQIPWYTSYALILVITINTILLSVVLELFSLFENMQHFSVQQQCFCWDTK